jgi:hypothetical protein
VQTHRFAPRVFLVVYACVYVLVFARDWPLFRYYPLRGTFSGDTGLSNGDPGMAWYGIVACATTAATIAPVLVPDRHVERFRAFCLGFERCLVAKIIDHQARFPFPDATLG